MPLPDRGGAAKPQSLGRQIANRVGGLHRDLGAALYTSGNFERLLDMRPIQKLADGAMPLKPKRCFDRAGFDPAVRFGQKGTRLAPMSLKREQLVNIRQQSGLIAFDRNQVVPPFCTIVSQTSRWQ